MDGKMDNNNPDFRIDIGEIKPLRDRIASSIRDSIIEGKIKPGQRLMEPEVAGILGVSRTPLREAFFQLEAEGFVKVHPRKGAVVSELSSRDAEDTAVIKNTLESLAARLSSEKITDVAIRELESVNEALTVQSKSPDKDFRVILELNTRFHTIINCASGNEKLSDMIQVLRKQTLRYNYIYLSLLSHLETSLQEHRQIIDALKRRDSKAVGELVWQHGERARTALSEYMGKKSEQFPKL
jgi:DNA-binding GntR family transcriptional regulator